jgi:hypothetical protein
VVKVGSDPAAPVFVDPSGARRRRLRLIAYGLAAVILLALLVLWLSQLGGPVDPPDPCANAPRATANVTPTATPAATRAADCR